MRTIEDILHIVLAEQSLLSNTVYEKEYYLQARAIYVSLSLKFMMTNLDRFALTT